MQKSVNTIVSLVWDTNNEWILTTKGGDSICAELMQDSYINPLMTILIFKCRPVEAPRNPGKFLGLRKLHPRKQHNVVLLKDNINENDFRRLRVRLKVGKPIEQNNSLKNL